MARMTRKDLTLLCRFRRNSRESLTTASRKTGIPVSTIFDKLQRYQGSLIRKQTLLLNFKELGYTLKVIMVIRVQKGDREKLQQLLESHHRINSLYRASSGQDFIVEGIFKDLAEFSSFTDQIDTFEVLERKEFYIIEDIKQEAFMNDEQLVEIMQQV